MPLMRQKHLKYKRQPAIKQAPDPLMTPTSMTVRRTLLARHALRMAIQKRIKTTLALVYAHGPCLQKQPHRTMLLYPWA